MYFLKNHLLYSGAWFRQTKCIVMMTQEGSTKIVKFMTPRAGVLVLGHGQISHLVEMHYSFKNLLYTQAQIRLTKYKVMMTKIVSTKILTNMTPGAGVLALGRGRLSLIVKIHYFFLKIFSTPKHRSNKLSIL